MLGLDPGVVGGGQVRLGCADPQPGGSAGHGPRALLRLAVQLRNGREKVKIVQF